MPNGQVVKEWVSAVPNLDARDILPVLIDATNESVSMVDYLEIMGASYRTIESKYNNITNSELFQQGTIQSSTGAPGTSVTIVLTPATAGACRDGSIAYLISGNTARVSIVGSTVTLQSVDGTNIVATDVAAGATLTFPSYAGSEGSFGPTPEKFAKNSYTNVVQIFKSKLQVTDIQMASEVEVVVDGQPYYQNIQLIESYLKHRKEVALAMLISRYSGDNFSSASPTLTDPNNSNMPVNTTMGLDQSVTTNGINYPLINPSVFDLPDMQAIDTQLNSIRAPKEYMAYVSTPMNQKLDIFNNALNNSGMLSNAGRFVIDGKDLELGINTFTFFNRTYDKMPIQLFDDPNTLAASGVGNISKSAYLCPKGSIKTVGGPNYPYLSLRYMTGPDQPTRYMAIPTGGLAPVPTSDQSVYALTYSTIQGLQVLGANFFMKIH